MELRQNNPTDPGYKHNVDKGCLEKLSHTYIVCQGLKDGSLQVCVFRLLLWWWRRQVPLACNGLGSCFTAFGAAW